MYRRALLWWLFHSLSRRVAPQVCELGVPLTRNFGKKQESTRSCSLPENRGSLAYRKPALLFKRLLFPYTQLRFEYFVKVLLSAAPQFARNEIPAETDLEKSRGKRDSIFIYFRHAPFFFRLPVRGAARCLLGFSLISFHVTILYLIGKCFTITPSPLAHVMFVWHLEFNTEGSERERERGTALMKFKF